MLNAGVLTRVKNSIPSFEELKERAKEVSFQDLLQHRDLVLYVLMLLVIVYTMYLLSVEPEKIRMNKMQEKQKNLKAEVETLLAEGVQGQTQSIQFKVASLQQKVSDMAKEGEEIKAQWLLTHVEKGDFLREISLLPYAFGWQVLALEETGKAEDEESGSQATLFQITGEGSFEGLIKYLKRIEHSIAPAQVMGMEIQKPAGHPHLLQSTLQVRVMSLQQESREEKED